MSLLRGYKKGEKKKISQYIKRINLSNQSSKTLGQLYEECRLLNMYELHFTSELVPGNVNWGKIVQFSSQALTRRWNHLVNDGQLFMWEPLPSCVHIKCQNDFLNQVLKFINSSLRNFCFSNSIILKMWLIIRVRKENISPLSIVKFKDAVLRSPQPSA